MSIYYTEKRGMGSGENDHLPLAVNPVFAGGEQDQKFLFSLITSWASHLNYSRVSTIIYEL